MELRRTVCNRDCPDTCGVVAHVDAGRVVRLAGDPDHPVTRGFLCWRTNHFLEQQYSPARLTQPLLRKGGELTPVSWDEALDVAATTLARIRAESGPAAVFHYRSGGSLGITKVLCDYFFERFGPVTIKRGDICSGAGEAAQHADFGEADAHDVFDLHHARSVLLWGKNLHVSSPHLIPVLNEARRRGARLALIDPVYHRTAELCDRYVQPRPGGDFALAIAVARVLFDDGLTDPDAGSYCDHLEEFRALTNTHSLERWCADAGVAVEDAVDLARRLAEKPCAILVGWGMGRRVNVAGIVRALDALGAISGNLARRGGGVSFYYKRRGAFDTSFVQGAAVAPRAVCEPLLGQEVLAASDPPIRAVWITAGNPVAMLPDSQTTARALASREFVVVVDPFLTDTARLAHLVLPTTTLLESDDIHGSYGHHWIGVSRPVVPPPPGVMSDLEILQQLATRLGMGDVLAGTARDWKARLLRPEVKARGVTVESLERDGPQRNPLASEVLFEGRRFQTPTRNVNLVTAAPPPPDRAPEGYPLTLLSLSTERSQSSQWPREPEGPAVVTVHPDAAGAIPDGARARLESRIGTIEVVVQHDPRQRRDVAIVPKGGHLHAGRCANVLIRARLTDQGEGAALYDEHVRLVPVSG